MHEAGWRMLDRHEKTHYVSGWLKITTFRSTLQFTKHICIKGGNLALQIKASKTPLTSIIPASFPMVKSTGRKNHTITSNQSINLVTWLLNFKYFRFERAFFPTHVFTVSPRKSNCQIVDIDRGNSVIYACVRERARNKENVRKTPRIRKEGEIDLSAKRCKKWGWSEKTLGVFSWPFLTENLRTVEKFICQKFGTLLRDDFYSEIPNRASLIWNTCQFSKK